MRVMLSTSLAPAIWGTTYVVTTQCLPPDRPFFISFVRAFPIGLLVLAYFRRFPPRGIWFRRVVVLGALNIGLFFALLFTAAYRLPGGVIAVTNAIQPFVVITLAWVFLGERLTLRLILAACAGVFGVGLIFINSPVSLDIIGAAAALAATLSWACGTFLTKFWGQPPVPPLVFTAWQLVVGGLLLLPFTLFVEGVPTTLSAENLLGFAYLGIVGTGIAYALWFRGIERLNASTVTFLTLLSPVSALAIDFLLLNRNMNLIQIGGVLLVFGSIFVARQTDRKSSGGEVYLKEKSDG